MARIQERMVLLEKGGTALDLRSWKYVKLGGGAKIATKQEGSRGGLGVGEICGKTSLADPW